jgi:tetratricopeptide (TPR) repeat protein
MADISFPPIGEIRKLCRWLTGNLDSVGKFRAASAVTPEYLYITKYHPSYIENLECPQKLEKILSGLNEKKVEGKKPKNKSSVRVVEKLLFKGMPKIGKTRAVYEKVIKELDDFLVFFPSPTELGKAKLSEVHPTPSFKGLKLVLFLDDLDEYVVNAGVDLRYFISRLEDACDRLLVVATLRTGVEETDKVMADRRGREFLYDFQEIKFGEISDVQAAQLAKDIGKKNYEFDGTTPGSIVFGLSEMRHRLEKMGKNERAVCNTLKLLSLTFIPEPQKETVKAVSDIIFNTNFSSEPLDWSDCIERLKDNDLIIDINDSLKAPHRDFYECVYAPGYIAEKDDFEKLEDIFADKSDARGLSNLGTSFAILKGEYEKSVSCYDKAIEVDPKNVETWNNRGNNLHELQRYKEAVESYDKALEVDPRFFLALYNKGISLHKMGKVKDAKECIKKAREIDPNLPEPPFMKE